MTNRVATALLIAAAGMVCLCGASATAAPATTVIVESGDAAPDGNGAFISFAAFGAALNDAGQVAFRGSLSGTIGGSEDNIGLFRYGDGTLTEIVREGEAAPDGNGTFADFQGPLLNNSGHVAFRATLNGTIGGTSEGSGIYLGNGNVITRIARTGQATPGAIGEVRSVNYGLSLNDAGATAFMAGVRQSGSTLSTASLFLSDGTMFTQIARRGEHAPDMNGTFRAFDLPDVNDTGEVAFIGDLEGIVNLGRDSSGIFRSNGAALVQIAREGQIAPDGDGTFWRLTNAQINNAGQVSFNAILIGTSDEDSTASAFYRSDEGILTQIARSGQPAPDGNGTFSGVGGGDLNGTGQTVFIASLVSTVGGDEDNQGIYRGDGDQQIKIARKGQAAPDGNGTFGSLGEPFINDAGQVAFNAGLNSTTGGESDDVGIFLFDDNLGLMNVAREGDPLLGSTIAALNFAVGHPTVESPNVLNSRGQVAYGFTLTDGRHGIALWTIPEPTSLVLCGVVVILLGLRRGQAAA